MDFVTIFYNNNIDIKLLEIQALSFKYLKNELCNKIILFFNSNNDFENTLFQEYIYNKLINIYPVKFRNRIEFYTKKIFNLDCKNNWTSQQLLKLIISKKINTEYYCVLDTKNHFIKNVILDDFINLKPKLYYNYKTHLNSKFISSLKLFNNDLLINDFIDSNVYEFSTTTPFIFKTEYVKQLTEEISNFNLWFLLNNDITEFFLYISYLIKINKINEYIIINENKLSFIFFNHTIPITEQKIIGIHHAFIINNNNSEKKDLVLKSYEDKELQDRVRELFDIKNKPYI